MENIEFFIGIVPPEEISKKITEFQKKFFYKEVVEPHVTIKTQSGLTEDKGWVDKVQDYLKKQKVFTVKLGDTQWFRDEVLFLSVQAEDVHKIHYDLIEVINPSLELRKKYFEDQKYTPHLTLGEIRYGLSKDELISMEIKAKEELGDLPEFEVSFARIYIKSSDSSKYNKFLDIPLSS